MLEILIFEWMIGGGRFVDGTSPDPKCPFEVQGKQMALSVAKDMVAAGLRPHLILDERLVELTRQIASSEGWAIPSSVGNEAEMWTRLTERAASADKLLIIAPESDGILSGVLDRLAEFDFKYLQPDRSFVEQASDKRRLLESLAFHGIKTPPGFRWQSDNARNRQQLRQFAESCSLVPNSKMRCKPNDGAGGEGHSIVQLQDLEKACLAIEPPAGGLQLPVGTLVEMQLEGISPSVSAITCNGNVRLLPPTLQVFDDLGQYTASQCCKDPVVAKAATELAQQVVEVFQPQQGYFGMDMIVDPKSGIAHLVEINPRLTSSYTLLSEAADGNLAKWMVEGFSD